MLESCLQLGAFVVQTCALVYKTVRVAETARIFYLVCMLMNHACKMITLHEYRYYFTVVVTRQNQIKVSVLVRPSKLDKCKQILTPRRMKRK